MSTRTIRVRVDTTQAVTALNQLNTNVNNLNRTSRNTSAGMSTLGSSVSNLNAPMGRLLRIAMGPAGIAVAMALIGTKIVQLAEKFQQFETNIKSSVKTMYEFETVSKALIESSVQTGTTIEANGLLFKRLQNALAPSGKTVTETTKVISTLNKAFAVSGVNANEASASLTQLSQAFSAGVLRGDEFRSVAEQAPIILRMISESSDTSAASLKSMAENGLLTSEVVFKALIDGGHDINEQFKKLPVTFSRVGNSASILAEGLAGKLNDSLGQIAANINGVTGEAQTMTSLVAVAFNDLLGSAIEVTGITKDDNKERKKSLEIAHELNIAQKKLEDMRKRGLSETDVFLVNQGRIIKQLRVKLQIQNEAFRAEKETNKLSKEAEENSARQTKLAEDTRVTKENIAKAEEAILAIQNAQFSVLSTGDAKLDSINKRYKKQQDALEKIKKSYIDTIPMQEEREQKEKEIEERLSKNEKLRNDEVNSRRAAIVEDLKLSGERMVIGTKLLDIDKSGDEKLRQINSTYDKRVFKLNQILEKNKELFEGTDEQIEVEKEINGLIDDQEAARRRMIKLREDELAISISQKIIADEKSIADADKNIDKSISGISGVDTGSGFEALAEESAMIEEALLARKEMELRIFQEELDAKLISKAKYDEETKAANDKYNSSKEDLDKKTKSAENKLLRQTWVDNLATIGQFSKKAFKIQKAASIANTVINTSEAIGNALKLPFPQNIAVAASMAIKGYSEVRKIKSTTFGGGGSSGGGSSGGGAGAAPAQIALSQQAANIGPSRDTETGRSSFQNQLLTDLSNIDSEIIPTSYARKIAVALVGVQQESGVPTNGFNE